MLYIDCSNTRLVFTCEHFVDILSRRSLGRSLDSPSNEGITLLGVGEILAMEHLELSILLDKSVGEDGIDVEYRPVDGIEHECDLRCGYAL